MKRYIFSISLVLLFLQSNMVMCEEEDAGPQMAPNGQFVGGGDPQMAPDGTFVGGSPQMAPDGTFVGGNPQMAPDGTFVGDGQDEK